LSKSVFPSFLSEGKSIIRVYDMYRIDASENPASSSALVGFCSIPIETFELEASLSQILNRDSFTTSLCHQPILPTTTIHSLIANVSYVESLTESCSDLMDFPLYKSCELAQHSNSFIWTKCTSFNLRRILTGLK
jgi:hypothetical protein